MVGAVFVPVSTTVIDPLPEPVIDIVRAEEVVTKEVTEETNEEIFDRIAEGHSQYLKIIARAIVEAESQFVNVCNVEEGCVAGIGIFQIVQSTFDEQCGGDVYDAEDNILCGFKMLENEEYWRWGESADVWTTLMEPMYMPYQCSCIKTARHRGFDLPLGTNAEDLEGNTTPRMGVLALFTYVDDDGNTIDHAGEVIRIELGEPGFWVSDGNFRRCRLMERFIYWIDPSLRGFGDY